MFGGLSEGLLTAGLDLKSGSGVFTGKPRYFTFLTRSIQVLYCLFCRVRVCVLGKVRARTKATAKVNQPIVVGRFAR